MSSELNADIILTYSEFLDLSLFWHLLTLWVNDRWGEVSHTVNRKRVAVNKAENVRHDMSLF